MLRLAPNGGRGPTQANTPGRPRLRAASAVSATVVATMIGLLLTAMPAAAVTGAGTFVPIAPCRLVDSRVTGGALAPNVTRKIVVAGVTSGDCAAKIPAAARVSAAAINLTAVPDPAHSSFGFLTLFPSDHVRPPTSSVNFHSGEIIANLVTATLSQSGSPAGAVSVFNGAVGSVNFILDVQGYYLSTTPGSPTAGTYGYYHPIQPCRLVDSRDPASNTAVPSVTGALPPNISRTIPVNGSTSADCGGSIPSGVLAIAVTTTAFADTAHPSHGFLTVYPNGAAKPKTSSVTFTDGESIGNLVTTKVGSNKIVVFNGAVGAVDFTLDISGYYTTTASGGSTYVPLTGARVLDTRPDSGLTASPDLDTIGVNVTGAGLAAIDASAAVLNITVVPASDASGSVTVFPHDNPQPNTTSVVFPAGMYRSALTMPGVNLEEVDVAYNGPDGKYTDVIVDIQGYFAAPAV